MSRMDEVYPCTPERMKTMTTRELMAYLGALRAVVDSSERYRYSVLASKARKRFRPEAVFRPCRAKPGPFDGPLDDELNGRECDLEEGHLTREHHKAGNGFRAFEWCPSWKDERGCLCTFHSQQANVQP